MNTALVAVSPKVTGRKNEVAGRGPEPGQAADQRADQAAEEGIPDIVRLQRDREPVQERGEGRFHALTLETERPDRERCVESFGKDAIGDERRRDAVRRRPYEVAALDDHQEG